MKVRPSPYALHEMFFPAGAVSSYKALVYPPRLNTSISPEHSSNVRVEMERPYSQPHALYKNASTNVSDTVPWLTQHPS